MKYPKIFETLERRQYLAGITLLDPAWNGGLTGWLDTAENAITADLGGAQNVPRYVLTIAPNSDGTLAIQGATHVDGTATPQANNPGQILVTLDYTSVSTNPDYPMTQIGSLITNYLETTPVDGVTWASLPIHLISTSRGTALSDAIAQSLDTSGIWVDQETYLDPNPDTSGPFLDNLNAVYDNVEFADDYWRTNGANVDTNPSGHPLDGAYNYELTAVQSDYSSFAIAHLAPPSFYDGTIEPSLIGSNDGDGTIHADWYGDGSTPSTFPAANQTGFLYSLIGGGTRPTSGLWPASGGTGDRTAVTHSGTQWPNISDVTPAATSAQSDTTLAVNYIHQDQGETDSIAYYLDTDQNPFDGSGIAIGTQTGLSASTSISSGSYNTSLTGVTPGTYYVDAQVTDSSGLVRYDYSQQQVTITAAPPAITVTSDAHSNPAIVTGATTHLIAGATDLAGEPLTYTWTFTHLPAGAHQPTISANGRTTAYKVPVTFYKQGGYRFTCTITDTAGHSITTDGSVNVVETATRLAVSPANATVKKGNARRFSTTVLNQFGHTMDPPIGARYAIVKGAASITTSGVFHASSTTGTALIRVEEDGLTDMVDAFVVN